MGMDIDIGIEDEDGGSIAILVAGSDVGDRKTSSFQRIDKNPSF